MKLYKCDDGRCNISGSAIRELRESAGWSQEQLAGRLQLLGLNLNQKAISRIETGDRVVPDFELLFFSKVFNVSLLKLMNIEKNKIETLISQLEVPRNSSSHFTIDP